MEKTLLMVIRLLTDFYIRFFVLKVLIIPGAANFLADLSLYLVDNSLNAIKRR